MVQAELRLKGREQYFRRFVCQQCLANHNTQSNTPKGNEPQGRTLYRTVASDTLLMRVWQSKVLLEHWWSQTILTRILRQASNCKRLQHQPFFISLPDAPWLSVTFIIQNHLPAIDLLKGHGMILVWSIEDGKTKQGTCKGHHNVVPSLPLTRQRLPG